MKRIFLPALVALAVVLGLYYDVTGGRATKTQRAAMPAASLPPVEEPPAPLARAARAEVTHFRIGHRNVKAIHADAGALWVATSDGLIRYDIATERHDFFDRRHGLASSSVFTVGRARGQVLAGTAAGQLAMLDERSGRWTSAAIAGAGAVLDVLETKSGDIWMATLAGVVLVPAGAIADPERWVRHSREEPVYAIAEGRRGDIWLGTERGVARFANGRWDNGQLEGQAERVTAIKVDARGHVWAGTWGKGLRRFDGKAWRTYGAAQGLPGNHVFALFEDRGVLWIGTENGVARMKGGKLEKKLRARDGLLADKVFALATTSDGSLWVGTFGGVARIRPVSAL